MIRSGRLTGPAVIAALALLVSGCGYALAGTGNSLPGHIKVIGVPVFQNLTPYADLDRIFTEAVRTELRSRRQYTVNPDAAGADAVLTLSIQSLNRQVTATTSDTKLASRIMLTVILSGDFKDVKNDKVLWTRPTLRLAEDYDLPSDVTGGADLASLFVQDPNALERIAKKFAQSLVPSILSNW